MAFISIPSTSEKTRTADLYNPAARRITITIAPILFSTLQPILPVYIRHLLAPYTPRAVLHSSCHPLSPLLLGPIALTPTFGTYLSRLLQSAFLWTLPLDTAIWAWAYFIVLASARVLTGWILTRSVGWAAPRWFSHYALYESSGGFGPGLSAVLAMRGQEGAEIPFRLMESDKRRYAVSLWGLGGLMMLFCWTEVAPWTYLHAWLGIILMKGMLGIRGRYRSWRGDRDSAGEVEEWEIETLHSAEMDDGHSSTDTLPVSYSVNSKSRTVTRHVPWGHAPLSLLTSLLAILLPYLAWSALSPSGPPSVHLPPIPPDVPALMDILVLTYPRPPSPDISAHLLNTTIASYLPFLSGEITLSVFTHAPDHPAFDRIKDAYSIPTSEDGDDVSTTNDTAKIGAGRHLTFYQDLDSHQSEISGHFLHLAEAFRFAAEQNRGEWIMLVEDDFPVCWGERGWGYIMQVLNQLEKERLQGNRIRYGWVATGGSGLIIHHSLLRMLHYLLHTYSASDPIAPNSIVHPAPDELIQSCLLGRHSACLPTSDNPHYQPSIMQSSELKGGYYGEPEPQMIITSRLVLDHIGGMATTTEGKAGNTDKWRCGWRHPYHGADEVEVVVVQY